MKIFKTLILSFLMISPMLCLAENDGTQTGDIKIYKDKKPSNKPNAPTNNYIICTYGYWFLQFTLPSGVNSMTVEISSDEYFITEYISEDNNQIDLPAHSGLYEIRCYTLNGDIYSATLNL